MAVMADDKITVTAHVNLSGFGLAAGETGEIDDSAEVRVAEANGMVTVHDTGQGAAPEERTASTAADASPAPTEAAHDAESAAAQGVDPDTKAEKPARAHRASKAHGAPPAENAAPAAE